MSDFPLVLVDDLFGPFFGNVHSKRQLQGPRGFHVEPTLTRYVEDVQRWSHLDVIDLDPFYSRAMKSS